MSKKPTRKQMLKKLAGDQYLREKLVKIIENERDLSKVTQLIDNEIQEQLSDAEFNYEIKGFLHDVAFHLNEAIKEVIGFSSIMGESNQSGSTPPKYLDVSFSDGTKIKVPYGRIDLPAISESSYIEMAYDYSDMTMHVRGVTQKRFLTTMDNIISLAREKVKTDSIYSGTAFSLGSNNQPEFLSLDNIDKTPLILNQSTLDMLIPVYARIEKTQELLDKGIDIKLGVLLSGPYGTGKSLLAFKLAKKAVENNWTFIYNKDPKNTVKALEIAYMVSDSGSGVLFFTEDIDLILSGERDTEMNEFLNLLDSGDNKNRKVISMFTTNHLEKINPTFLRGKRIGSLIEMGHLDKEASERFIRTYLKGLIPESEDLSKALDMIEENRIVPAFLAEICEKTKAIPIYTGDDTVTESMLIGNIKSYLHQISVLNEASKKEPPKEVKVMKMLREILTEDILEQLDDIQHTVDNIYDNI